MKKRLIYIAVVVSMVLSLAATAMPGASPAIQATGGTIWHVDDNGDQYNLPDRFSTIQAAIDNESVKDGDTIVVYQGTYNEDIIIYKALTILAPNGSGVTTIVGSGGNGAVVTITVNGVTFGAIGQGFTVTNAYTGIGYRHSAMTGDLKNTRIAGNKIHYCSYGISLDQEANADMHGNTITGNTIYDCDSAGIYIDNGNTDGNNNDGNTYGNTISGNIIYDCYDGITFYNDDTNGNIYDNTVENNNISAFEYTGISFINGYDGYETTGEIYGNTVHNNTITNSSDTEDSIAILFGNEQNGDVSDNTVSDNTISLCGWGIDFDIWSAGDASDNTISGNTIRDCGDGIGLYDSQTGGDVSGNTVDDNTVYNCSGSGIELWSESYAAVQCIVENTVSNNRVNNCSDGILLWSEASGNVSLNTVESNTVSNCSNGIRLYASNDSVMEDNTIEDNIVSICFFGIYLDAEYGGNMSGNDILDNTIEYDSGGNGIYLYAYDGGHIEYSTIEDNKVYGNTSGGTAIRLEDYSTVTIENIEIVNNTLFDASSGKSNLDGIRLYDCQYINISGNNIHNNLNTGLHIQSSNNISVTGNTVHNNSEGIYLHAWDSIVSGNDIRDNYGAGSTGIYVDYALNTPVTCNNIVGNDPGLYSDGDTVVDARYNWWGDDSGPGGSGEGTGDNVSASVNYASWLTEELTFDTSSVIVDTAAVPGTVSLFDGNYDTTLIVEVDCNLTCEADSASANLSKLLLDMLPANFEEYYVSQWEDTYVSWWNEGEGAYLSDIWQEWMTYLSTYPMYHPQWECDTCGFTMRVCPMALLASDPYGEEVDELNLPFFFCTQAGGYYEEDVPDLWRVIYEQLRLGEFNIPVTVTSCWGGTDTATIPLTIVDFQVPLANGWNLRSAPVALDPDYTSWGTIRAMADGVPDLQAALKWNDATARWEELVPGTAFAPLQAYFIKVSGDDSLPFITNRDLTGPYSRQLSKGWNLVGPAPDYAYDSNSFFSAMNIWDTLYSVQLAAGDTTGWINASSVSQYADFGEIFYYGDCPIDSAGYDFSQCGWNVSVNGSVLSNECQEDPSVTPFGGYWVYMQNADELAGFSYTPMPWELMFFSNENQ